MVPHFGIWSSVHTRPPVASITMVKVTITLHHKHEAWHVLAYEATFADGSPRIMPAPPTRRFVTQKAAINYVKRLVLGCLHHQSKHATGMDITCHVHVLLPGEKQIRG